MNTQPQRHYNNGGHMRNNRQHGRRNSNNNNQGGIKSQLNGETFSGTPHQLVKLHEDRANEAQRREDRFAEHLHFQHADHFMRVITGEAYQ